MAYKIIVENTEYKFERSGFFGTGTDVKVYRNGVLYKDMSFKDLNGDDSLIDEGNYFENICKMWAEWEEFRIGTINALNT